MALLASVMAYLCLGLGITRIKIANNTRLRELWYTRRAVVKCLVVFIEPIMAFYRGWETLIFSVAAFAMGTDMELAPDDSTDPEENE